MKYKISIFIVISIIIGLYVVSKFNQTIYPSPTWPAEFSLDENQIASYPTQSKNSCGPYSVAILLDYLGVTGSQSQPEYISKHITWRKTPKSITYPPGLSDYIRKSGYDPIVYDIDTRQPISHLTNILYHSKNPIIILGQYDGYQHYVVVLGYDTGHIHIYNPLWSDDTNDAIGNQTMSYDEFEKFWSAGGQYGLYRRYALGIDMKGSDGSTTSNMLYHID